jgi:hypothetical protein
MYNLYSPGAALASEETEEAPAQVTLKAHADNRTGLASVSGMQGRSLLASNCFCEIEQVRGHYVQSWAVQQHPRTCRTAWQASCSRRPLPPPILCPQECSVSNPSDDAALCRSGCSVDVAWLDEVIRAYGELLTEYSDCLPARPYPPDPMTAPQTAMLDVLWGVGVYEAEDSTHGSDREMAWTLFGGCGVPVAAVSPCRSSPSQV